MGSRGEWYVLVEANEGGADTKWRLRDKVYAEEGREQALALAEEWTLTCGWRGGRSDAPEKEGRRVYRLSETSWLVEIEHPYWSDSRGAVTLDCHVRVSVAELVHVKEHTPARPPAPKSGVLSRAFRRT